MIGKRPAMRLRAWFGSSGFSVEMNLITHNAQLPIAGRWKPGHSPRENPSFPVILVKTGRKREPISIENPWIPAFAGMAG